MLLFQPRHVQPILNDEKDWTRRLWAKQRINPWSLQLAKTKMLSKEFFAVLQILHIQRERLTAITEYGAQREGGYTRREYLDLFREMHKLPADANPFLFAIQFKRVPDVIAVEVTTDLHPGDRVVMADCIDVVSNPGKVWTVLEEPWNVSQGVDLVKLKGSTGGFRVQCLRKVTLRSEVPA